MPMRWLDMQGPEMHSEKTNKDVPPLSLSGFSLWGKEFKEKGWGLQSPPCNMDGKSPNAAAHRQRACTATRTHKHC